MMKLRKYTCSAVLSLAFLCLASCSDKGEDIPVSPLAVTESAVDFTSAGGEGKITVTSTTPIMSVTSSDDWCKATVEGEYTVGLEVNEQLNPDNRMAMVTITDGNGNVKHVSVTQSGLRFNLYEKRVSVADDGSATLVRMEATGRTSFQNVPEWLHPASRNDSLILTADANTTGNIREGNVIITCGNKQDSIDVIQGDVSDIVGDYYLVGYTNFSSQHTAANINAQDVVVSYAGGDSLTLTFPGKEDEDLKCNVYFDKRTFFFRIYGGTYVGQSSYNRSYPVCKLCFWGGGYARLSPQLPFVIPWGFADNLFVSTEFKYKITAEGYIKVNPEANSTWTGSYEWSSIAFVCERNMNPDTGSRPAVMPYPAAIDAYFIKRTPGIPEYKVKNKN